MIGYMINIYIQNSQQTFKNNFNIIAKLLFTIKNWKIIQKKLLYIYLN